MENKNKTAVEWFFEQLTEVDYGCINKTFLQNNNSLAGYKLRELFNQAKAMEKEQSEQKDSIISQIDLELTLIEDYAKGEVGDAITLLRKKIDNYYKTNEYE